jgi:hypothetical protein
LLDQPIRKGRLPVINVRDYGKITDKGQFGHEPPLAGLPCPFKHGGTPVSRYVNWHNGWGCV